MKTTKCKRCEKEFVSYTGSVSRKLCFHCDNDFHKWMWGMWRDPCLKYLSYLSITRQINWWIKYQAKRVLKPEESSYRVLELSLIEE